MILSADKSAAERMFVHLSGGSLHVLRCPWLQDWARYLHGMAEDGFEPLAPAAPPAKCIAQTLITPLDAANITCDRVVGVAALRDPSVGDAVFVMQNDGTCCRVQLELLTHGASVACSERQPAADSQVEAHLDAALKQLAHNRDKLFSDRGTPDLMWEQCQAELASASSHGDAMASFGRSLAAVVGQGSALRTWGALVEETKARLIGMQKRTIAQPEEARTLEHGIHALAEQLRMLCHKASLADAVQQNLEMRSRALRLVLRSPELCPCGDVSEEEQAQHRKLLALRDRVLEGQRMLHKLIHEAGALSEPAVVDDEAFKTTALLEPPQIFLAPDSETSHTMAMERLELKHQTDMLERLRLQLKESLAASQTAVDLAQAVVSG